MEKSVSQARGETLDILIDNLYYYETIQKVGVRFKIILKVIINLKHQDPNVSTIKPLNGKSTIHKVNWQHLFDL